MRRLLLSSATLARTVASPGRPWLAVGNLAGQRLLLPPPLLRAVVAPKLGSSRNFSSRKHKGIGRKLPKEVSSFAHGSSADGALHFKWEFLNSSPKLKCTGVCRRREDACGWLYLYLSLCFIKMVFGPKSICAALPFPAWRISGTLKRSQCPGSHNHIRKPLGSDGGGRTFCRG